MVSLVEINLASRLADGTVRAYQQALTLHMMPINLIGVAISNAAFPQLTEHLGEGRNDLFSKRPAFPAENYFLDGTSGVGGDFLYQGIRCTLY